ncbi:hypothetical protein J6590_050800 [Homalodisca vitripennis]|nr:hypothetical protein J6590_050800 [Homalodisca vitripennis]
MSKINGRGDNTPSLGAYCRVEGRNVLGALFFTMASFRSTTGAGLPYPLTGAHFINGEYRTMEMSRVANLDKTDCREAICSSMWQQPCRVVYLHYYLVFKRHSSSSAHVRNTLA